MNNKKRNELLALPGRSRLNETLSCILHCGNFRHGVSRYCSTHLGRLLRYGGPTQQRVEKSTLAPEVAIMRKFLKHNDTHPSVIAAQDWLTKFVRQIAEIKGSPGQAQMRQLVYDGFTESAPVSKWIPNGQREMLATVLATFYYAIKRPAALPANEPLTYALFNHLIRLASPVKRGRLKYNANIGREEILYSYPQPGAAVRRLRGREIRTTLASFADKVFSALERQHQLEVERRQKLETDFKDGDLKHRKRYIPRPPDAPRKREPNAGTFQRGGRNKFPPGYVPKGKRG